MKLVSFSLPSPMGPQIRTGALDAAGGIVNLAGALRGALLREGLTPGAAARVSAALLPGDMVALIEGATARSTLRAKRCNGRRKKDWMPGRMPGRTPPVCRLCIRRRDCISCRRCRDRRCCVISWGSRRTCGTSSETRAAIPPGVVQDPGVLQGQRRQPRRPWPRRRHPVVRDRPRLQVRAGDGHRQGRR